MSSFPKTTPVSKREPTVYCDPVHPRRACSVTKISVYLKNVHPYHVPHLYLSRHSWHWTPAVSWVVKILIQRKLGTLTVWIPSPQVCLRLANNCHWVLEILSSWLFCRSLLKFGVHERLPLENLYHRSPLCQVWTWHRDRTLGNCPVLFKFSVYVYQKMEIFNLCFSPRYVLT